jgi:protein-S-isoprenylcysteine O-methyltransferase Ste14
MGVGHTAWTVVKTVTFLLGFWFVFVFAVPIGISIAEVALGIQRFPPKPVVAAFALLGGTLLGSWSALTFAIRGGGTPLPLDPPVLLVTQGPYAYLRHPFVLGFSAQVVGLGTALGSVPVLAYVTTAMAIWYFFVRPAEERALEERFGERMREYRRAVRGFRPRLRPYRVR